MVQYDIIIIGRGIVGLSAAIYAGRLNLKTLVIGKEKGGKIVKTNLIENYPGFKKISGMDLFNRVLDHTKDYNIEIYGGDIEDISCDKKSCFIIKTKKKQYKSKTILFCTGSKLRKLNVKGEREFEGKGVHSCALCDGPLYNDKILAVIGGGDSAVKESLLLSKYAKEVYIIARNKLKPEPINLERLKRNRKINIILGTQIKEIRGNKFVNSLVLDRKFKNSNILKLDGVFVNIGYIPLSNLGVKLGVKLNKNKEMIIDKESKTNIKGIYAAGDITDTTFKQAITGIGESVKAVYSIYEYINHEKVLCSCIDEK
ncbi:MAG: FAD-dependent oxidoreductase [Candidatus Pacearchaeota archaeon]|jgi:thioredoxin-disulfide reductase|nr:thioredoxin-disulfide reductase [Candidatus Pacearchaeota archaeon]MDP7521062.1 FAD-dependent oxidoreductase [Candidatus Pacearchaeota archaeon]|tara:strand:- start:200 stop:1141 length:942 start_codon:yes stop_codon:yes gene_type:complete